MDQLDQLVHATQGRIQYEFPPDPRDRWKDEFGRQHPPPQPNQGVGPVPPGLQLDLTASSGSVRTFLFCSLHRSQCSLIALEQPSASVYLLKSSIITQHIEGVVHKVSKLCGGFICSCLEIQVSNQVLVHHLTFKFTDDDCGLLNYRNME